MLQSSKLKKTILILMAISTVIYVSTTVYANFNVSHRYVAYAAYKYEQDTSPTKWYTVEELGIVGVHEVGGRAIQIAVDLERAPFPFGPLGPSDQKIVFWYKDAFYTVANRWVSFAPNWNRWVFFAPVDYGILKAYFAERLETEPPEWNTTKELGVTFGKRMEAAEKDTYEILIVDLEKALPWMNGTTSEPYAVKYGDNFYRIVGLWVEPGLPESIIKWQSLMGVTLGVGWTKIYFSSKTCA